MAEKFALRMKQLHRTMIAVGCPATRIGPLLKGVKRPAEMLNADMLEAPAFVT